MKFHPDQLRSLWEYETNGFSFLLTLWHLAKVKVNDSDDQYCLKAWQVQENLDEKIAFNTLHQSFRC